MEDKVFLKSVGKACRMLSKDVCCKGDVERNRQIFVGDDRWGVSVGVLSKGG
jgi:hypothetical protein